jgi:hypothetical protein
MFKKWMFVGIACCILVGCSRTPSKTAEDEIGYGTVKDHVYSNSYFNNMSVTLPEDWALQSRKAQEELNEMGNDIIAGDNDNLKRQLQSQTETQTVTLFSLFKHELGAPVNFNPNIICTAERVSYLPGVKDGADYLELMKTTINSGQLKYKFSEEFSKETLAGTSFDVMIMELNLGIMTVRQKCFATKIKDYVLAFAISYTTEKEEKELMKILDTLQFNATKDNKGDN